MPVNILPASYHIAVVCAVVPAAVPVDPASDHVAIAVEVVPLAVDVLPLARRPAAIAVLVPPASIILVPATAAITSAHSFLNLLDYLVHARVDILTRASSRCVHPVLCKSTIGSSIIVRSDAVPLADVSTELDHAVPACVTNRPIAASIRVADLQSNRLVIIPVATGGPCRILLLHVASDLAVHTNTIITTRLSRGGGKNISALLGAHHASHVVDGHFVNAVGTRKVAVRTVHTEVGKITVSHLGHHRFHT